MLTVGEHRERCGFRVVDLRTGTTADHPLTQGACYEVRKARISPDGRLAAISYQRAVDKPLRLAVVDLTSGASRLDVEIPEAGGESADLGFGEPVGLAWLDDTRVRVAMARPPDTSRVYRLEEGLRVHTFEVR